MGEMLAGAEADLEPEVPERFREQGARVQSRVIALGKGDLQCR